MALDYWVEYPQPNITGGFANLTSYGNIVTNGMLGIGIIVSFWVILFLIFRKTGDWEALTASSFITVIAAGILMGMDLINYVWIVIPMIMTAAGIFMMSRRTG